jgi:hypothetical protein
MDRPQLTGRRPLGPSRLLLPAATMAGLALVLSFGATRVLEGILSAPGGEAGGSASPVEDRGDGDGVASAPIPLASYRTAILERDIFDLGAGPGRAIPAGGPPGDPSGDTVLIATVVTADRVGSSAMIATGRGEGQRAAVYGLGAPLGEGLQITAIDQGRVTVGSERGEERQLLLGVRAELPDQQPSPR